jgi:hypothetical protein
MKPEYKLIPVVIGRRAADETPSGHVSSAARLGRGARIQGRRRPDPDCLAR